MLKTMQQEATLVSEIRAEIDTRGGRMTFERFMECALYHPRLGYYTSGRAHIGKAGDYFTSVSVGPLFGTMLAAQFRAFHDALGSPPDFQVVEFGGQCGRLRDDVLAAAPGLRYRIIERGDVLDGPVVGCIFSNEFLDALPVHRVRVAGGEWKELYVTTEPAPGAAACPARGECRFVEVPGPLSTPRLAEILGDLPVDRMEGYQTEVNLRALDWQEDVARKLRRGFVLTIDYGYERHEYFAPQHRAGTLLCYYRHTKNDDPFRQVGEQDITAHVEFTSLIEHGRLLGLEPVLFTDQSHYLVEIGRAQIAEIVERTAGQFSRERAAVHQLIHPELMGRTFKVLIQEKRGPE